MSLYNIAFMRWYFGKNKKDFTKMPSFVAWWGGFYKQVGVKSKGSWDTSEVGFCHFVSQRGLYFCAFQKSYFIDTFTRISCFSST
jgi:hypothetical protein